MNHHKFITEIPQIYHNWEQQSVLPKSNDFSQILDQLNHGTSPSTNLNVLQLLNCAVKQMNSEEIYCEIGCDQGISLIGALINNPQISAYSIDNFSRFDNPETAFTCLIENLSRFNLEDQVFFYSQSFEEFFEELRTIKPQPKIGVYFCNLSQNYRSHLMALLLAKPFLSPQSLIITTQSHRLSIQQANQDFISTNPECSVFLDFTQSVTQSLKWGGGIQVLKWDATLPLSSGNSILSCHESVLQFFTEWQKKEEIEMFLNQASYFLELGEYREALSPLLKAIKINNSSSPAFYLLGFVFEKLGQLNNAVHAYQKTIDIDPSFCDAYNNLGNLLLEDQQIDKAEIIYRQAIAANPNHFGSYINLGNVLMAQANIVEAITIYEKALALNQNSEIALYNLELAKMAQEDPGKIALYKGDAYYRNNNYLEAISEYEKCLKYSPVQEKQFYITFAYCYESLEKYQESIEIYQQAIKSIPNEPEFYYCLIEVLKKVGQTQEADRIACQASQLFPEDVYLKLAHFLMLPILYENHQEIEEYRRQFIMGLDRLIEEISLETETTKKEALTAISKHTNFFLQYQGQDDLELQIKYGQFVHKIMTANYPEWSVNPAMPALTIDRKIKIGYVSECLRGHTVGQLALGWLRYANRDQFDLYCYSIYRNQDNLTQEFKKYSDHFYHLQGSFESTCEQILSDQLHILVFLDIGMCADMTKLAALRLAPIQCTSWGHPITSGLPTVDYFLSSDEMEPEAGQKHYSETLIRLPKIGFSYPKPVIPEIVHNRGDFFLREDAIVYLSCQSLFKYLPQYDYVFAKIAQKVPNSQFVFLAFEKSVYITDLFKARLQKAFAAYNLQSEDYCVILNRQSQIGYFNLNSLSDVFLDSFSWSGGRTTLEAIACGLPVVTYPGEFMRGRHACGILRSLGVTETIAGTEAEYIDIAVRLGQDSQYRQEIVEKMKANEDYLYDDQTCVQALEEFYAQVVKHPAI